MLLLITVEPLLGPLREFLRPSGVVNVVAWFVVGGGILDGVAAESGADEGGDGRLRDVQDAGGGEGAGDMLVSIALFGRRQLDDDDDDDDGRLPWRVSGVGD